MWVTLEEELHRRRFSWPESEVAWLSGVATRVKRWWLGRFLGFIEGLKFSPFGSFVDELLARVEVTAAPSPDPVSILLDRPCRGLFQGVVSGIRMVAPLGVLVSRSLLSNVVCAPEVALLGGASQAGGLSMLPAKACGGSKGCVAFLVVYGRFVATPPTSFSFAVPLPGLVFRFVFEAAGKFLRRLALNQLIPVPMLVYGFIGRVDSYSFFRSLRASSVPVSAVFSDPSSCFSG
ncbi:LOW QUALITY PROTEIN: hypothetical protein YC2023_065131 [Brassica napus]